MCGISGLWQFSKLDSSEQRLRNSLHNLRHRGPDDIGTSVFRSPQSSGELWIGQTRLAVIDLSAQGHQPMNSADERYLLAFNGEITNYLEIRKQLRSLGRVFRSESDTEVLLQALEVWGKHALQLLEGFYAFALLDRQSNNLLVARDVYGIKPLYFSFLPSQFFAFSSEISGLLPLLNIHPTLNWQTAVNYLEWGTYDSGENTFVEDVFQLKPGHFIEFNLETLSLKGPIKYWEPSISTTSLDSYSDSLEKVRNLFLKSVNQNLRSDVPVGVALSGGIDSSAITSAVRFLEKDYPLNTFSFISPGFEFSEDKWVNLVVSKTNAISHLVASNSEELFNDLDELITLQGEPFGSTSIYAQFRVFQKAREQGVVVTLDGQGADELFAGYSGYPAKRLHSLIEKGHWLSAVRYLNNWSQWPSRSASQTIIETAAQLLPPSFTKLYLSKKGKSPAINYRILKELGLDSGFPGYEVPVARGNRLKAHLRSELMELKLPALLRHGDRNSMHFSVESRVPFLNRELTEYVLSLPEHYISGKDGSSKTLLRAALKGIVPQEILDRKDKIGFATPEGDWLSNIDWEDELSEMSSNSILLNSTHALSALNSKNPGALRLDAGGKWRILNLVRWARTLGISLNP